MIFYHVLNLKLLEPVQIFSFKICIGIRTGDVHMGESAAYPRFFGSRVAELHLQWSDPGANTVAFGPWLKQVITLNCSYMR